MTKILYIVLFSVKICFLELFSSDLESEIKKDFANFLEKKSQKNVNSYVSFLHHLEYGKKKSSTYEDYNNYIKKINIAIYNPLALFDDPSKVTWRVAEKNERQVIKNLLRELNFHHQIDPDKKILKKYVGNDNNKAFMEKFNTKIDEEVKNLLSLIKSADYAKLFADKKLEKYKDIIFDPLAHDKIRAKMQSLLDSLDDSQPATDGNKKPQDSLGKEFDDYLVQFSALSNPKLYAGIIDNESQKSNCCIKKNSHKRKGNQFYSIFYQVNNSNKTLDDHVKFHVTATPWSALKVWKIMMCALFGKLDKNDIINKNNRDGIDILLNEKLEKIKTDENLEEENLEYGKFNNLKNTFKFLRAIPILRTFYTIDGHDYFRDDMPYSTQAGKFITIYLDSENVHDLKGYSDFFRDLDAIFNHLKEIGYLRDIDALPLVGDAQLGTSGFIFVRYQNHENDDRFVPFYYDSSAKNWQDKGKAPLIENMPILWNEKWYFLGDQESQKKENSDWQKLLIDGKKSYSEYREKNSM